jgi:hypothetical protein
MDRGPGLRSGRRHEVMAHGLVERPVVAHEKELLLSVSDFVNQYLGGLPLDDIHW